MVIVLVQYSSKSRGVLLYSFFFPDSPLKKKVKEGIKEKRKNITPFKVLYSERREYSGRAIEEGRRVKM